ncbi:MAG: hypothetical protein IJ588_12580 [Prevotella sp.]|nr:hypothetical protein [Prevotella sp.]
MSKWNNFYLQRMGTGSNGSAYPVCESVATWGMWCSEIPFKLAEKAKEPAKRSFHDEHGDEEFIPSGGLMMEAYDMKVKFGCKRMTSGRDTATYGTQVSDVRQKVKAFLDYLRQSGMMKMYSTHTRIGRRYVRLQSVGDNAKWVTKDDMEFLMFEVTLKVNDPVTDVTSSEMGIA